jgi:stress response protein SCP2
LSAELVKGANTRLRSASIHAELLTDLDVEQIDMCAMLLGPRRRVRGDGDFVFFNQKRSACGSTRLVSPVQLQIDLARIPSDVEVVVLAATLDDRVAGSFAAHGEGFVVRDGAVTIRHSFDGLSTERCVIAAEVYRRDGGWKLRAVSQGYDNLTRLVHHLGVQTNTATAPDSPGAVTPSPATPPRSAVPAPAVVAPLPVARRGP